MQTWLCVRVGRTAVHQPVSIEGQRLVPSARFTLRGSQCWFTGRNLRILEYDSRCCLRPKLDVIPKLVANGLLALASVFGIVSQL